MSPTPAQNSLNNFYRSVQFSSPRLAALMADNVLTVALNALSGTQDEVQWAAEDLRKQSEELPEALKRVLASALAELGYS